MRNRTTGRIHGRKSPELALVVAILAISTAAILVRWSDAPSIVVAFYRVVFTVGLLLPFVVTSHRHAFRTLSVRDVGIATIAGVALAIHFAAWFESLEWTSVAASVTLVQMQPIFVAVGAALVLGERVTIRTVAGILTAIIGACVISSPGLVGTIPTTGTELYGNGLAILGAFMAACYVLVGRSLRQRIELLPYVTVVYVSCAVVLLLLAVTAGHELLAYPVREWSLFLALAIGPGLLGHTVINWVLAHVDSSVVSVTLLGEPVGATILAALLLSEFPASSTIVGGAIVLVGIGVTTRAQRA